MLQNFFLTSRDGRRWWIFWRKPRRNMNKLKISLVVTLEWSVMCKEKLYDINVWTFYFWASVPRARVPNHFSCIHSLSFKPTNERGNGAQPKKKFINFSCIHVTIWTWRKNSIFFQVSQIYWEIMRNISFFGITNNYNNKLTLIKFLRSKFWVNLYVISIWKY